MQQILQLDPRDNVLIALTDLKEGEHVQFKGSSYSLLSSVPAKHKFVITDLPVGGDVIMYGVLVGKTHQPVRKGEVLTLRNLRHEAAQYHEKSSEYAWRAPNVARWRDRKFLGYRRADGQVGHRNHDPPLLLNPRPKERSRSHRGIPQVSRNDLARNYPKHPRRRH